MNILFLTITRFNDVEDKGVYSDLMRRFRDEGHNVYVVAPLERRFKINTFLESKNGINFLGVKTLNIQKTNIVEKGIGTLLVEFQFKNAINKYIKGVKFDLILYSTPPITFTKVIKSIKKRDNSFTYLLLKDIFPQNAVDIKMIKRNGIINNYFRKKEIKLYMVSDCIGCMSQANVNYILKHNHFLNENKVEINPNCIEVSDYIQIEVNKIRIRYSIPLDIKIFVYGGNLGKPQGVDFLIKCLDSNINRDDVFFVIVGSGTEYNSIKKWIEINNPLNVKLIDSLKRDDYYDLIKACDIGMIFLDNRFTIPNYPSRLLAYLENKMPILAATDVNTDIGKIAEENGYGFWCESRHVEDFNKLIDRFINMQFEEIKYMGEKGFKYLCDNYNVDISYSLINNKLVLNN